MDEALLPAGSESEPLPARPNPGPASVAMTRCGQAYARTLKTALARGQAYSDANHAANKAYRLTMPGLVDSESVLDFIACVAQGMLMGAITESQSARLLYAAQVAASALRRSGGCEKPGDLLTPPPLKNLQFSTKNLPDLLTSISDQNGPNE